MNKKLGFIVDNLGASQLGFFLTKEINKYHENHSDININVFFKTLHKVLLPRLFTTMQIGEAYFATYPLIATSLSTAYNLLNIKTCKDKWYYVWELEWLTKPNQYYETYYEIFKYNTQLQFITRSQEERQLLLNNFNTDSLVIQNFNMLEIIKHVS